MLNLTETKRDGSLVDADSNALESSQGNNMLTGRGGQAKFVVHQGDGIVKIADFGGVGTGTTPAASVIAEVDTLQFSGAGLSASSMTLTQEGSDLHITFADVEDTQVVLKDFHLEDLDNLEQSTGASIAIGNILFAGQTQIEDSFDVFDANEQRHSVFNPNSVTFLNDLDNSVRGFDNSNDVVSVQGGNDRLYATGGRDKLIGGDGDDIFVINSSTGSSTVAEADLIRDFSQQDRIGLSEGLTFEQLELSQGRGTNVGDTVITDKLTGQVLAVLQGVNAGSLDQDDFVYLPSYTFTKIAGAKGSSSGGFPDSFSTSPAINNEGTVAFRGFQGEQGEGIFTGSGGALTSIATSENFEGFRGGIDLNDKGTVVFVASESGGSEGIFTSDGRGLTSIADTSGPYVFFGRNPSPAINNEGTVAFLAEKELGVSEESVGVFAVKQGGETITIADNNGPLIFPIGDDPGLDYPAINDKGTVAFAAYSDPIAGGGIFTSNGGAITLISSFSFGASAINNEGTVAFKGFLSEQGEGIFTGSGAAITTIADTSGPFGGGDFGSFGDPAINNAGTVAFAASLDTGGGGIFTGSDPVADKVIAEGDALFGSEVISLGFFVNGLNDKGQLAFYAELANGTEGIFRADPVLLG